MDTTALLEPLVPRHYQEDGISAPWHYFNDGGVGNPLVAMPTGTGKSLIIGESIKRYSQHYGGRYLMVTHVQELIEQNAKSLLQQWPTAPLGIFSAGLKRKEHSAPIVYAGIQTAYKNPLLLGHFDLVFVDEAHLVPPRSETMYGKFFKSLKVINPQMKTIGYTATPYRLKQGLLTEEGGMFTDLCCDWTTLERFNQLLAEGYLSPVIPKHTKTQLDVSGVGKAGGEFIQSQLQAAVDVTETTWAAVQEIVAWGHDRSKWLVFAAGIDHAEHITGMLEHLGISSLAVHSKMSPDDRAAALAMFRSGEVQCLVNRDVLTTGFDEPGIDLIGVLRPSNSPGLWVQMLGRGTRPAEGKKNCLVLDFAGNTARLGPINDPVVPRRKKNGNGGSPPVKLCPECGTYNHAAVRECVECSFKFPPPQTQLASIASTAKLIREEPEIKVHEFVVDVVTYLRHDRGLAPSLKVRYHCGLRTFEEYVLLEHSGWALHKGREWWRLRFPSLTDYDDVPSSIEEALEHAKELITPVGIRVDLTDRHPLIIGYDWSGSDFLEV